MPAQGSRYVSLPRLPRYCDDLNERDWHRFKNDVEIIFSPASFDTVDKMLPLLVRKGRELSVTALT